MRINKKSNLPEWFDMENYKAIADFPDDEIVYLIQCRANDILTKRYNKNGYFENDLYYGENHPEGLNKFAKVNGKTRISSSSSISPISLSQINAFKKDLSEIGIDINDEHIKNNHLSAIEVYGVSITSWPGVVCSIDLLTKQDETIIDELKVLLKKWRSELNFEEHHPLIGSSWEVIKNKVINYNAFAFCDLQMWQMATKNTITSGVLAVTLYPEGQFDSIQIAQTIKPFTEKLFTFETLEKIEREISNK